MATLLRRVYADKALGEGALQRSDLDWTIVHPTLLNDGPKTGTYRVGERLHFSGAPKISRADVADFLLKQTGDATYTRRIVMISD